MIQIVEAKLTDLRAILELQYLAYQSEAELVGDYSIPPLKQTLDEVVLEFQEGILLKAFDGMGRIIGSVRGTVKDDTLYIGKLIVHPDYQGQGTGTRLLREIEHIFPWERYELFTSSRSLKNLALYRRMGYVRYKEREIAPGLKFVYLEKRDV